MRRSSFVITAGISLALVGAALLPATTAAQINARIVLDNDGLRRFHLAIGDVYRVPVSTVSRVALHRLPPYELSVVFYLAREARVSPETVIALRDRGWSWWDVSLHLGLSPAVFGVRPVRHGPPWGRALGYWKKHEPRYVQLSDREIVDRVNLDVWVSYERQPAGRVAVYRERDEWDRDRDRPDREGWDDFDRGRDDRGRDDDRDRDASRWSPVVAQGSPVDRSRPVAPPVVQSRPVRGPVIRR